MPVYVVVGCFSKSPRDATGGTNFHRLPNGVKAQEIMAFQIKQPNSLKLSCGFVPISLFRGRRGRLKGNNTLAICSHN